MPSLALAAALTAAAEAIERYVPYVAAVEGAIAPPPTLAPLQQELGPHVSLTRVPIMLSCRSSPHEQPGR